MSSFGKSFISAVLIDGSVRPNKGSVMHAHLWQGGQALLLDVPDQLVPGELQALLHVELGHVYLDEQVALIGGGLVGAHHHAHAVGAPDRAPGGAPGGGAASVSHWEACRRGRRRGRRGYIWNR